MRHPIIISFFLLVVLLPACRKSSFGETDPVSGTVPEQVSADANSSCRIQSISQVNGSAVYYSVAYTYGSSLPTDMRITDPAISTTTQQTNFTSRGDTVFLGAGNWLLKDAVHGQIIRFYQIEPVDKDTILYHYTYDSQLRLVQKKSFYNGSSLPDFITDYFYSGDQLIGLKMQLGDGRKLMESSLSYDPSITIKPWLYFFTDAFESNRWLQAFPFGKKSTLALKQIQTHIYDTQSGSRLDTWTTAFAGYVISQDRYVLQCNSTGDNQQGLSFLTGTLRVKYVCK